MNTNPPKDIQKELERLQRYDDEISKEMNEDFKDWWENSKEEWPLIARYVLEIRREQLDFCYDMIDRQNEHIQKLEKEIETLNSLLGVYD